ncbi:hypothetical protein [Paenibacillus sp. Soil787]|uniref:hypothetical protein n=1 Tax=Paenibacillus sp. Soil787 TaxID=1736411 RepID=UPI0012E370BC|nr:hypothetical protein [Paenibacillus sp. Soil787]
MEDEYPLNASNPHYLSIQILDASNGVGIKNEGYTGIPIRKGESYQFSFYARRSESFDTPVILSLESADGKVYGLLKLSFIPINGPNMRPVFLRVGTITAAD